MTATREGRFILGEDSRSELPVSNVIAGRFSPRSFAERLPTDEEIALLLEAARLAPSAFNEQPWRFVIARAGSSAHEHISASLSDNNRVWAPRAPVLMVAIARTLNARTGEANTYGRYDLGLAVGSMLAQATSMGIGLHQIAGFSAVKLRESLVFEEDLDLVTVIAMGFPGDPEDLQEPFRTRELSRTPRKAVEELIIAV